MSLEPLGLPKPLPPVFARARAALGVWFAAWRLARPGAPGLTVKMLVLDVFERALVSALFFAFVYRMAGNPAAAKSPIAWLLMAGEALPFVYVVSRMPSMALSQRPTDWYFGILGTMMPLLVRPAAETGPLIPLVFCYYIMIAGISLQLLAKCTLGRAFSIVAANRGVKVRGPYRLLRHPMYAGYTVTHIGFLLAMPSALNAFLYASALAIQIVRITREERVLRQDENYRALCARVRWRLLPGVF